MPWRSGFRRFTSCCCCCCCCAAAALLLLLTMGHGLLLSMDQGSSHRTGLDLLAAGGLLALGLKELLASRQERGEMPGWAARLDGFCAMALAPLLGLSALLEVASPDDLFLFAKSAGSLLAAHLGRVQELVVALLFAVCSAAAGRATGAAGAAGRQAVVAGPRRSAGGSDGRCPGGVHRLPGRRGPQAGVNHRCQV